MVAKKNGIGVETTVSASPPTDALRQSSRGTTVALSGRISYKPEFTIEVSSSILLISMAVSVVVAFLTNVMDTKDEWSGPYIRVTFVSRQSSVRLPSPSNTLLWSCGSPL